jgi:hypothetical protein
MTFRVVDRWDRTVAEARTSPPSSAGSQRPGRRRSGVADGLTRDAVRTWDFDAVRVVEQHRAAHVTAIRPCGRGRQRGIRALDSADDRPLMWRGTRRCC